MSEYYGCQQNDYRNYLIHYGKGQKAKNHKYIDIVDGRYIYPEDKGGKSKIDTTKSQKKVNSDYGYHVRAKQINAYLRKQDSNFATVNGVSVSNSIRKTPFKKTVRKSNKLNSNANNESYKQFAKGTIRPFYRDTKAKAKGLISNSKTSRFDTVISKLKSGSSKVSKLLSTPLSKIKKTVSRGVQKVKNKRNLQKARDDINQRVFYRYDNYAALGKTPKGGFTFKSPDGKTEKWANNSDDYKTWRHSFVNEFGRKNTKRLKRSAKENKEG